MTSPLIVWIERRFIRARAVEAAGRSDVQGHSPQAPSSGEAREKHAFTLIELLTVIAIIGVLAGLTVGLTGLATRKSKEGRIHGDMQKIITAVQGYKDALGFYPPDHRVNQGTVNEATLPAPNQLFYELSGTLFQNNQYTLLGSQEVVPATAFADFGITGFSNSTKDKTESKFNESFKASQFKGTARGYYVLAVPVKGVPGKTLPGADGIPVNPWMYVSTSPTNNANGFDLWTEALINGKTVRFSNWEKDPVVLP